MLDIGGLHVPGINSLKDLDENGMPKENWEENDRAEQLDETGVPEEAKQSVEEPVPEVTPEDKELDRANMLNTILELNPTAGLILLAAAKKNKTSDIDLKTIKWKPIMKEEQAGWDKLGGIESVWEKLVGRPFNLDVKTDPNESSEIAELLKAYTDSLEGGD